MNKSSINNIFFEREQIFHSSLFSGIGGFDLAAEWCGWDNIFQVEIDKFCQKVLTKNFPNVKRYGDIKEFDGTKYTGTIDVISGGFPCQPFSIAGKRKGKEDDRYIWDEMLRVISEIKPKIVVCENVTGIISLELDKVLSDLEAQDYSTETFIIPACAVNAPHKRERIWIISYSNKERLQYRNFFKSKEIQNIKKRIQNNRKINRLGGEWITSNTNDTSTNYKIQTGRNMSSGEIWKKGTAESCVCGVDDGLPNRVDRIKGLGNAIVPQIAFEIFYFIDLFLRGER